MSNPSRFSASDIIAIGVALAALGLTPAAPALADSQITGEPRLQVTATPSATHPLYGLALSLAGALEMGDGDAHPSVWVKAVNDEGRTTVYTTAQLESLGYRVEMPQPNQVVLIYGNVRLMVRTADTM